MNSALIINDVPVECINKAAVQYHIPATLIISVLRMENGHVGDAIRNSNGTYDYGPMQINSIWLPKIEKYGYTRNAVRYDPCTNVSVGTWLLSKAIADEKVLWRGVGNYHSHTIDKNMTYRSKVQKIHTLLTHYLANPSIKTTAAW
jgi:Transglycosylase SLT domain